MPRAWAASSPSRISERHPDRAHGLEGGVGNRVRECRSLGELHHDEHVVAGSPAVEDAHHVRVLHCRGRTCLGERALNRRRLRDDLDGHGLLRVDVPRAVHRRERTRAERRDELVPIDDAG